MSATAHVDTGEQVDLCVPQRLTVKRMSTRREGGIETSGEDDSRCVNHYGGGTERHGGAEGVSLMRTRSNWHALFLRLADATPGPDRKAESQTGSS